MMIKPVLLIVIPLIQLVSFASQKSIDTHGSISKLQHQNSSQKAVHLITSRPLSDVEDQGHDFDEYHYDCPAGLKKCGGGLCGSHCTCPSGQVPCASGQCIPKDWECDSVVDCDDGSDEMNCQNVMDCGFRCHHVSHCIPLEYVCDGEADCPDFSDEQRCDGHRAAHPIHHHHHGHRKFVAQEDAEKEFHCPNDKFQCQPLKKGQAPICIPFVWVCDGQNDCPEGQDEQNCPKD